MIPTNTAEVRRRFERVLTDAMKRARYLVTGLEEANDIIAKLSGRPGEVVVARLVECAMLELGLVEMVDAGDPNSQAMRVTRRGHVGPRSKLAAGVEQ